MLQGPVGRRDFTADMVAELQAVVAKRGPLVGLGHGIAQPVKEAVAGRLPAYERSWRESGITAANLQVNALSATELLDALSVRQSEFDAFPWLHKCLTA